MGEITSISQCGIIFPDACIDKDWLFILHRNEHCLLSILLGGDHRLRKVLIPRYGLLTMGWWLLQDHNPGLDSVPVIM